jgi:hypothetical protein
MALADFPRRCSRVRFWEESGRRLDTTGSNARHEEQLERPDLNLHLPSFPTFRQNFISRMIEA